MKNLKAVAAAVALALGSSGAYAITDTSQASGSALFLVAWNSDTAGSPITYARELRDGSNNAVTLNQLVTSFGSAGTQSATWNTAGFTYTSAGDSLWAANSSLLSDPSIHWTVVASENVGGVPSTTNPVYTVTTQLGAASPNESGQALQNAKNTVGTYIASLNNLLGGCAASCVTTNTGDPAFSKATTWLNNMGNTLGAGFNDMGTGFSDLLSFWLYKSTSSTAASSFAPSAFAGRWSLDAAGDVTYSVAAATVPVPGALWLFGSGLLGLIGVSRRRKNAA